jgi:hypothetical protein
MTAIPAILAKIGVPILAQMLAESLTRVNNPAATAAAKALGEFKGDISKGAVDTAQLAEANRHAEEMCRIYYEENKSALAEVNRTIQDELDSEDKYVRRMRPTFGYVMALTWFAQMMAVAYIIVFSTGTAYLVLQAVESLSVIWTVGLSVLGIYVYRRSDEKRGR